MHEVKHQWTIDEFCDALDYLSDKAAAQAEANEQARSQRTGGGQW